MDSTLNSWQPRVLSIMRIMFGLLIMQHGLMKLFAFPGPFMRPVVTGELIWFAAIIELVGGLLLVIGLMSRWAAFVLAGLMAFAYFMGHAGKGFFPILNGGNLAIAYCFACLYLFFAGPGPWSVDAQRGSA